MVEYGVSDDDRIKHHKNTRIRVDHKSKYRKIEGISSDSTESDTYPEIPDLGCEIVVTFSFMEIFTEKFEKYVPKYKIKVEKKSSEQWSHRHVIVELRKNIRRIDDEVTACIDNLECKSKGIQDIEKEKQSSFIFFEYWKNGMGYEYGNHNDSNIGYLPPNKRFESIFGRANHEHTHSEKGHGSTDGGP